MSEENVSQILEEKAASNAEDITAQATSKNPTTAPQKNPKRVAAGKAAAKKARETREANKKILEALEQKEKDLQRTLQQQQLQNPEKENPIANTEQQGSSITFNQVVAIFGIGFTIFTYFFKAEDVKNAVKNVFSRKKTPPPQKSNEMQKTDEGPHTVLEPKTQKRKSGIYHMD